MGVWSRFPVSLALIVGVGVSLGVVSPIPATTLERLTLDEMTRKSTAIVRARVTGSRSANLESVGGSDIYTYFRMQVLETWKSGPAVTEVAVPGGAVDGIRQSVSGAPVLKPGQEYVLFLWTSRSGLTQVIGLSQGLFQLSAGPSREILAQRPPASELMLDRSGHPVEDLAVSMPLQDLRARVRQALGAAK
jgi:hypothetical protein